MDLCESPTQVHPASSCRLAVLAGVIMLIYKKHGSIYWINSGKGRSGNPAQKLKADQASCPLTYWLPLDCISPSLSLTFPPGWAPGKTKSPRSLCLLSSPGPPEDPALSGSFLQAIAAIIIGAGNFYEHHSYDGDCICDIPPWRSLHNPPREEGMYEREFQRKKMRTT